MLVNKKYGGGIIYNGIIIKVVFEKSMNGYNPGYCDRYSGLRKQGRIPFVRLAGNSNHGWGMSRV